MPIKEIKSNFIERNVIYDHSSGAYMIINIIVPWLIWLKHLLDPLCWEWQERHVLWWQNNCQKKCQSTYQNRSRTVWHSTCQASRRKNSQSTTVQFPGRYDRWCVRAQTRLDARTSVRTLCQSACPRALPSSKSPLRAGITPSPPAPKVLGRVYSDGIVNRKISA